MISTGTAPGGLAGQSAPALGLGVDRQDPVHAGHRAEVHPSVEHGGVDLHRVVSMNSALFNAAGTRSRSAGVKAFARRGHRSGRWLRLRKGAAPGLPRRDRPRHPGPRGRPAGWAPVRPSTVGRCSSALGGRGRGRCALGGLLQERKDM